MASHGKEPACSDGLDRPAAGSSADDLGDRAGRSRKRLAEESLEELEAKAAKERLTKVDMCKKIVC